MANQNPLIDLNEFLGFISEAMPPEYRIEIAVVNNGVSIGLVDTEGYPFLGVNTDDMNLTEIVVALLNCARKSFGQAPVAWGPTVTPEEGTSG